MVPNFLQQVDFLPMGGIERYRFCPPWGPVFDSLPDPIVSDGLAE